MQAVLLFFCLTVTYALRVNLSVAIVAMVDEEKTNGNSTSAEMAKYTVGLNFIDSNIL